MRKLTEKLEEEREAKLAQERLMNAAAASEDEDLPLAEDSCLVQKKSEEEIPRLVVYKGKNYVPTALVDEKCEKLEKLEEENRALASKVVKVFTPT